MEEYWVMSCGNEWCSGPPKWGIRDTEPQPREDPESCRCPACGWLALPGSGIRRVDPKEEQR